jgi:hypothetical protein
MTIIPLILACPACNYERVMPTWLAFACLRIFVVLLVSLKRVDIVRILGVFVIYEVAYYFVWRYVIWYSHPAVAEGAVQWLAIIGLLSLSAGIPAAVLLARISKMAYFRAAHSKVIEKWKIWILLPFSFLLAFIQGT